MSTVPLRYAADVRTSSVDKHTHDGELAIQLCSYTDVYKNDRVRPGAGLMRATATSDEVERFRLRVGDSVLTKDSEDPSDIGISAYVDGTADDFVCGYHLAIARPTNDTHPRYLTWALRSRPILNHFSNHALGISRYGLTVNGLRSAPIPWHSTDAQRRIADFLDDRIARIDQILSGRRAQVALLHATAARASFETVTGFGLPRERRPTEIAWVGDLPAEWPLFTVSSQFQVDLGKMLDEKRQKGEHTIPYLRNTNVQWDTIDTDDLKIMDVALEERGRYTVRSGDLLICEGGQPGRSAIWTGSLSPLGFQKALHRARTRGRSRPAWLLECLRTAVALNVFAVENGQTTIGHLTNEQLRSLRFPFPDPDVQDRLLAGLAETRLQVASAVQALTSSNELLAEYKQALITAAVTGEIDVTTAGSGIPT